MSKVFIITEGGSKIGIGHITRCISLCQAFEEKGVNPEFIVNGDDTVYGLLRGRKYQIFNWLKEEDKLFEVIKDASIAIIDSYMADVRFYKRVSETAEIPVYIDDNKRIDYPKGIVVNGTIYAKDLDYPKREGTTYLLGSQYIPVRREFWDVREKEIKSDVESIMVTFGGDDARYMTPRILKFLNDEYPKLSKNVIVGGSFSSANIRKIEELKYGKTRLIYNPDVEKMKVTMLEADIAIAAGGQTLYELARIGAPTIAIAVADNQLNNSKSWQKAGFVKYAGLYNNNQLFKNIQSGLEGFEGYGARNIACLIGRRYLDGAGARRIAKKILA